MNHSIHDLAHLPPLREDFDLGPLIDGAYPLRIGGQQVALCDDISSARWRYALDILTTDLDALRQVVAEWAVCAGPEEPPECPPQYAVGGGKVGPRPERRAA